MLRDVFYYGEKPNVHPREQFAKNLSDARKKAKTEHFWIVNEFCDYKNFDWDFDFDFLPDEDVWAQDHNNVWPSQHQKDSGTWLCSKEDSDIIIYRTDVSPVKRKNEKNSCWKIYTPIDEKQFDFSWHPDPTDPLFIFVWGNKYVNGVFEPTIEYCTPGAVEKKYMFQHAPILPQWERWIEHVPVDKERSIKNGFDFTWRPDPREPAFNYVWGNKYEPAEIKPTLEYRMPGATQIKYMAEYVEVLPHWDRWVEHIPVDKIRSEDNGFDFSWRPDPREPAFNYVWGNKFEDAEIKPTLEYRMPEATQIKYMPERVDVMPQQDRWIIPENLDTSEFDFSWRPDPREPAYIYEFGTQWQKTGGPQYVAPEATEIKYVDVQQAKALPNLNNWVIPDNIDKDNFDFSWHPDSTEEPYIYQFGTQHQKTNGPYYIVDNAAQIKYVDAVRSIILPNKDKWTIPDNLDVSEFDFSWHPDETEPPYIYDAGTQWQKTGGPRYIVEGATQLKYLENKKAKALPDSNNWSLPVYIDKQSWDFSWHPDITEPPYIYYFPTQWALSGGPVYIVPGATENKYLEGPIAKATINMDNWEIPDNIDKDSFDFSWHPFAQDDPCIYQIGTQWQKTGGPRYITPGTDENSPVKYIDRRIIKSKRLPDKTNFKILHPIIEEEFDFSWHPDTTEEPYIYVFGNQYYSGEKMPTVEYHVEGATQYKYVNNLKAKLAPNKDNWQIKIPIDEAAWDFSWVPDPGEPAYIYIFGNQWHNAEIESTIEYHVPGASEKKYVNDIKATVLPDMANWKLNYKIDEKKFDFSWRPDPGSPPYIYVFGSNLYPAEEMSCLEYHVPDSTDYKFVSGIVAQLAEDRTNWEIPENIDITDFDFSWHPNPKDPAFIYHAGTQWQKTGGPKYVVKGAKEIKYLEGKKVKALPSMKNWKLPQNIDVTDFDFSWHPDDTEPPYIYQFGTQWAISGGPKYVMPKAREIKYIDNPVAKMRPNKTNWEIPDDIDVDSFDFSWHPYAEDKPYIYQFGTQWQKTGGPRYITPGTDEMSAIKYIDRRILKAKKLPNKKNFEIVDNLLIEDFDYSWHPDDTEPPYIYVFGNQWHNAEVMPTIKYVVPDATKNNYIKTLTAKLAPNIKNWKELVSIDKSKFDLSWVPNPHDPPYIYVWGNKYEPAEMKPTLEYHVSGATEKKYMEELVEVLPQWDRWVKKLPIDVITSKNNGFDFSWRPDPREPAYIYVFGNQWNRAEIEPSIEYRVPGATEKKYVHEKIAYAMPQPDKFEVLFPIENFDFSWRPDPGSPPYIYVFGNQWNSAEKEPTVKYKVTGATDFKYVNDIIAEIRPNLKLWQVPDGFDVETFDFSWRPDPYDPPYIYEFATEYADRGGPRYVVPSATEVKYMSHIKAKLRAKEVPKYYIETTLGNLVKNHQDEVFWALQKSINYDNFDFNWRPTKDQEQYIHVFGSPESEKTQTYFVNSSFYLQGYTDKNFVQQDKKADNEYLAELFVQPDIFFVDRGNKESQERFEQLKARFSNVSKTRFLNSWVDTINRCINRSNTELCWILNSELDYSEFDFKYYPNPWQLKMVHVFGTQWSHWGTTFMVNRETFSEDTKYIKIIEHLSNLNFVKERKAKATNNLYDVYVINHGNKELNQVVDAIKLVAHDKSVTVVDYDKSYLQTIKNIVDNIVPRKEHYIWVVSSICNYNNFDFTYICDPFARENLHVFPSDSQKFGDTFFLNVNHTKKVISELQILQQYDKVNFNNTVKTRRLPAPIIKVNTDTHVGSIDTNFDFPYAIFTTEEFKTNDNETLNLWQDDTKELLITSTGATRIVVPKEAKQYIKKELYDYPYIKTASKLLSSKPLDIVFLSNGEKNAEDNYKHLLAVTDGLKNRIVRVDGVNGRVDAYHAAVKASETQWAFTVFAKLKVNGKFDWGWQPDRLQVPKHYIFHAKNPVNGLEYGHQGMIAYNKQLVLNNFGSGLDFTLDDPHETVELVSGTANFNTDAYSTWRTAFREVIKLKSDYTDISQERLQVWLTEAKGKFAKDCLQGAKDAVEYYEEVNGDMDQLKLSYEWSWLKDYYNRKYK